MGHKFETDGPITLRDGSGISAGSSAIQLSGKASEWSGLDAWYGDPADRHIVNLIREAARREDVGQRLGGNGFQEKYSTYKLYINAGNVYFGSRDGITDLAFYHGGAFHSATGVASVSAALPAMGVGEKQYVMLEVADDASLSMVFSTQREPAKIIVGALYYDGTGHYLSVEATRAAQSEALDQQANLTFQMHLSKGGDLSLTLDDDADATVEDFSFSDITILLRGDSQSIVDTNPDPNDYDFKQHINGASPYEIPVMVYYEVDPGQNAWERQAVVDVPFLNTGTGRVAYWDSADADGLVECTDGYFVCYWYFVTNDPQWPVVGIPDVIEYATLEEARSRTFREFSENLSASGYGRPHTMMAPLAKVIIQTDDTFGTNYHAKYREYTDLRNLPLGDRAYDVSHDAIRGRMADDAHPQYEPRKLDFVTKAADYTATVEDNAKTIIMTTGNAITFPDSPALGFRLRCVHGGGAVTVTLNRSGANVFSLPKGIGTTNSMTTTQYGSMVEFVYLGSNVWGLVSASGVWTTVGGHPYNFDGNVAGAVTGNFASFDADDNIQDSGSSASSFAAATHASTHAPGGGDSLSENVKFTSDGGLAVLMVAGEDLVQGNIVCCPLAGGIGGLDGTVYKVPIAGEENSMPVGVVLADATSTNPVWVVVSGKAYVLPEVALAPARGNVIITSTSAAGRADQSAIIPAASHWREVGHWTANGAAGVLTLAILHFN